MLVLSTNSDGPKAAAAGDSHLTGRSRLLRAAGLLLVASALLLNHRALGAALAPDEEIMGRMSLLAIFAVECVLAILGLWLLLRPPRVAVPPFLGGPLLVVLAGVAGIGGWAEARYLEWVQPRILQLPEICDCWSKRTDPYLGTAKTDWATAKLKKDEA